MPDGQSRLILEPAEYLVYFGGKLVKASDIDHQCYARTKKGERCQNPNTMQHGGSYDRNRTEYENVFFYAGWYSGSLLCHYHEKADNVEYFCDVDIPEYELDVDKLIADFKPVKR